MRRMPLAAIVFAFALSGPLAGFATAAVKAETVRYSQGGTEFVGHLAYDDSFEGKRPGVLVLHEWWGLNEYAKERAEKLAAIGYVAFAADLYGGGQVAEHPQEAGAMAGKVRQNVQAWRARAEAGLDVLKQRPNVDGGKLAAIGYCFGGATALQLAYAGADLDAVVTFHAALPAATPAEAQALKAEIQVNHGAADTFVNAAAVEGFKAPLAAAKANWTFIEYANAKHGFTVPDAGEKGLEGLAYDPRADAQSWTAMRELFDAVWGGKSENAGK